MLQLFNADRRSVTFPERSALSSPAEDRLRLKPLPEVRRGSSVPRAPLLVLQAPGRVAARSDAARRTRQLVGDLDVRSAGERRCFGSLVLRGRERGVDPPLAALERAAQLAGRARPGDQAARWSPPLPPGPHDAAALFRWARHVSSSTCGSTGGRTCASLPTKGWSLPGTVDAVAV